MSEASCARRRMSCGLASRFFQRLWRYVRATISHRTYPIPVGENIGTIDLFVDPPPLQEGPYAGEWVLTSGDTVTMRVEAKKVTDSQTGIQSGGCTLTYGDPIPSALEWHSSNPSVATVNDQGTVSAIQAGNDWITVRFVSINRSWNLPLVVVPR